MGFHGECGKGWSSRCANANPRGRCRCKCGGANHGKLRQHTFTLDRAPAATDAVFDSVVEDERVVVIRDVGYARGHKTVTNDAAHVVAQLHAQLGHRRLFYIDSDDRVDELLLDDAGDFVGFRVGPPGITPAWLDLAQLAAWHGPTGGLKLELGPGRGRVIGSVEPMPQAISDVIERVLEGR